MIVEVLSSLDPLFENLPECVRVVCFPNGPALGWMLPKGGEPVRFIFQLDSPSTWFTNRFDTVLEDFQLAVPKSFGREPFHPRSTSMKLVEDGSTCPTLLSDVSDWQNHPAWVGFHGRYDPLLRRWCRGYGLTDDSIDEVCQRIWIELADRMRIFQYDPNRTFRGWLRRVCESRVLDFLRQRQAVCLLSLDDRDGEQLAGAGEAAIDLGEVDHGDVATDLLRFYLLGEAEKVQAAVRSKVKPWTWDAFWLVAVCDWTVERTAQALGMTHTAVYAARQRVARMLFDEGKRASDQWKCGS